MKHASPSPAHNARAHLARSFLEELTGAEPSPPPDIASLEEARELRDDDIAAAREIALVRAHRATLPDRVRAVVAMERAPVLLDDGSRMTREEAERVLAGKEERRAFVPLRRSLERASEAGRERLSQASDTFHGVLAEVLAGPADEVTSLEDASATLGRLLADLKDAAAEARSVLAREGRSGLDDPPALARGLDLPDPAGFSDAGLRRFGRALLEATGEHRKRALTAVKAPRAIAGVLLAAHDGAVRCLAGPSHSASTFLALSAGLGGGVALSLLEGGGPPAEVHGAALEDEALLLGAALSFGIGSAVARQAVLEESAKEAERRARVLAATRLLLLLAQAHAARLLLLGESRDALRETLSAALGADPPAALLDELLAPPWPGLEHLRGPAASVGAAVMRTALGASIAAALRDRYDEAFALVPSTYELFGGAREALERGAIGALDLVGARFDKDHPGRALVEWSSELL